MQPKVRNHVAIAAHMRNSAGSMGKRKRSKNRADRRAAKLNLKEYR